MFKQVARVSKCFQPQYNEPKASTVKNKNLTSNSLNLLLKYGVIRPAALGLYHLLPLGVRALEKLIKIVDEELHAIGAQKILMPSLSPVNLWKKSGRYDDDGNNNNTGELFTVSDRNNKTYILSPTHEETITDLIASLGVLSYNQFPLGLYQISSKFRDELKPRFGIMRSREFTMKDLYTFDVDVDAAKITYNSVTQAYQAIFNRIGVSYVRVLGETGEIGGQMSHEYHFLSGIGEDKIVICNKCQHTSNSRLCEIVNDAWTCTDCGQSNRFKPLSGIEVGHTFLLGDLYSKPLGAAFRASDGDKRYLQMGCYGLGLTRIVAGALEALIVKDDELRWPLELAPYKVVVIPPKHGSKEQLAIGNFPVEISTELNKHLPDDVIVDDRTHLTIGRRVSDAKAFGYPFVIVLGKHAIENRLELIDNATQTSELCESIDHVLRYILNKIQSTNHVTKTGDSVTICVHF